MRYMSRTPTQELGEKMGRNYRLTLLVRADKTGLGYQTRAYYKHLRPHKTVIIDLSPLNGNEQDYTWYENAHLIKGIPGAHQLAEILTDTDVLLTAETPYNLGLYEKARSMGVKTVCVENPEFYDHIKYPNFEMPDAIILPSTWMYEDIKRHAQSRGCKVFQLHHPVDREELPFTPRSRSKHFHIAGKPAAHDRNGTWDYMRAFPDGLVATQDKSLWTTIKKRYSQARVYNNIPTHKELYDLGDILILPRKYGGNCLPLNEALSSGVPVIMPDVSPNNNLLPKEWLVPATITGHFNPRGQVNIYSSAPTDIRKVYEHVADNIVEYSKQANEIADTISWETMKSKYLEVLESL